MNKKNLMKNLVGLAVFGALAVGSAQASYLPFTVTEGANYSTQYYHLGVIDGPPEVNGQTFTAGDLNGNYQERLTATPTSQTGSVVSGTFSTSAFFDMGNWVSTAGVNISGTGLNVFTTPNLANRNTSEVAGYKIFGLFQAGGNYSVDLVTGVETFQGGSSGALSLWLSTDSSSAASWNSSGNMVISGDTNKLHELAYSTTPNSTLNTGQSTPTGTNFGDFSIEYDALTLTSFGSGFFSLPGSSFYPVVVIKGQFNENPLTSPTLNGSANIFFATSATASPQGDGSAIPEPGTVALLGLGALGLGMSLHRRKH
jgi:hypothetical protein